MRVVSWSGAIVAACAFGCLRPLLAEEAGSAPAAERSFGADPTGLHLAVSEDGRRLAAMSRTGRFVVWDAGSAKPFATGEAGTEPLRVALVDTGTKLVAELGRPGRDAARVAVFDCATGKQIHEWRSRSEDPDDTIGSVALAGVLPAENAVALTWLERGGAAPQAFSAATFEPLGGPPLPGGGRRIAATRDGSRVVSTRGAAERTSGRWIWTVANADAFAGRQEARISKGEKVLFSVLAEGASAALFVVPTTDAKLATCAYGLADGKPLWILADGYVEAAASGSSPHVVVGRRGSPGRYELVDARTGQVVRPLGEFAENAAAALSPDGAWIYALTDDRGTIRAIPAAAAAAVAGPGAVPGAPPTGAGRPPLPPARKLGSVLTAFDLSRDGRYVAGASGGRVVLWATDSAKPLREFDAGDAYVDELAFSGDGADVLAQVTHSAGRRPEILRWDVATGARKSGIKSRETRAASARSEFDSREPGDVSLIGTPGPGNAVLVQILDVGFLLLDPDTGKPLHPDALEVHVADGGPSDGAHFSPALYTFGLNDAGTRVAVVDHESFRLLDWPEGRLLASVPRDVLGKVAPDVYFHRIAFCEDADWVVSQGSRGTARDREQVVLRLDLGTPGVPWILKDARLLDVSRGGRSEALVATKNGIELIDAATGRSVRRLGTGDGVAEARFIPGMRRAWLVSKKSGELKAVNLPD